LQEETTSTLEEGMMENIPENGVQPLPDVIVERSEEDTPMLHLELEDSEDTNIHEIHEIHEINISEEVEQDIEDMVNNTCNVSSYFLLRFKKKVMLLFYHFLLYYIS